MYNQHRKNVAVHSIIKIESSDLEPHQFFKLKKTPRICWQQYIKKVWIETAKTGKVDGSKKKYLEEHFETNKVNWQKVS